VEVRRQKVRARLVKINSLTETIFSISCNHRRYGLDIDELEEAQVNIPTQRFETHAGDRGEEDTATASQKLKSDLFVYHFTKIKNDSGTVVSVSCKHCSKTYKWSASDGYGTYRKHLERVHPCEAGLIKTQTQISRYPTNTSQLFHFSDVKNRDELA